MDKTKEHYNNLKGIDLQPTSFFLVNKLSGSQRFVQPDVSPPAKAGARE